MYSQESSMKCHYCGQNPPAPGRVGCGGCLKKRRTRASERRLRLAEKGLCSTCGKRRAVSRKKSCQACLMKRRKRYRARKAQRVCVNCAAPLGPGDRALCRACCEQMRNRPPTVCDRCGRPLAVGGGPYWLSRSVVWCRSCRAAVA